MRLRGRGRPPETCVQRLAAPGVCRRCAPSPGACRPTAVGGLFLPPLPHSPASVDTAGAFSGKFSPDGLTFRSFGSILFLESGCPILLCSLSRPVRAPDSFSVFTSAVGYEKEGWSSRRRSGGRGIAVKIPVMVGIVSRRKASFSALHPACLTAPEREKPWLTRRRRSDIIVFTGLDGEMAEWLKALVLKTSDVERHRGFESLSLRQRAWRSTQEAEGAPLLRE